MHRIRILHFSRLLVLLTVLCFAICAGAAATDAQTPSQEETLALLSGKTAGVMTGTPQDGIILAKIPDAKIQYFNSITDVALALEKHKVDFAGLPTVSYYTLAQ